VSWGARAVRSSSVMMVCYIGGLPADGKTPQDTRTPEQRASLKRLLRELHGRYPKALIVSHHDLNPQKACPCFDAVSETGSREQVTEAWQATVALGGYLLAGFFGEFGIDGHPVYHAGDETRDGEDSRHIQRL